MVTFPNSKINLGLNISSKREDNFHNLETCFYPLPLTDVLEILPSKKQEFIQTGLSVPTDQNICLKAYSLLSQDYSLSCVKIHLHKCCPIGAGLGGGSADAVYTLNTLNQLFNLNISDEKLNDYAQKLGSDCSFFLKNKPLLGRGRGEILQAINLSLKGTHILIVRPEIMISTTLAYEWVSPSPTNYSITETLSQPIGYWKEKLINDFEAPVFERYPIMEQLKNRLYHEGAIYASMSGTGSALYGLFDTKIDANNLFSDVWHWSGKLN